MPEDPRKVAIAAPGPQPLDRESSSCVSEIQTQEYGAGRRIGATGAVDGDRSHAGHIMHSMAQHRRCTTVLTRAHEIYSSRG